jgi:hypothetical protein
MGTVKKFILSFLVMGCIVATPLAAQSVDAGVKLYESANYKGAVAELDKVLAGAKDMKEKALARAYYYRGQSKLVVVRKNKDDRTPEMAKLVHDYAVTGIADLQLAKKNDIDGKMDADIQAALKKMQELLTDLADINLHLSEEDTKTPAEKKAHYEAMVQLATPVTELDKFNYKGYKFLADGQLGLLDSISALKNYHLADDWFFRSAPKDGDMAIAYTYIHIAQLEWYLNHKWEDAMKAITEGKQQLEGESKKIQAMSNRPPAEKAYLSQRHDVILSDIKKAELDLKAAAGK